MNETAATGELTYRRVHQAPPELLFDCMTQPEHLAHFWGPTGTATGRCSALTSACPRGSARS